MTIRVLLADDEPLVRAGLALLLDSEPGIEVVGQAEDGAAALRLCEQTAVDVVLMDVRMPVMDGVEATRSLAAATGRSPSVLVLTTYREDEAVHAALRAGARGFLLKDAAPGQLFEAIRSVHRGQGWLDPGVARSVFQELSRGGTAGQGSHAPAGPAGSDPVQAPAPDASVVSSFFIHQGDYWSIQYRSKVVRLRDSVGLRYLDRLLKAPDTEIHASDLIAMDARGARREGVPHGPGGPGGLGPDSGNAGPLLDAQAKRAYRARIVELQADLEEAEAWSNIEAAAQARIQLQLLTDELARGVGLGGRDRLARDRSERDRVSVTKAIRQAVRRLHAADLELGRHLECSVRTGAFCSYQPEPPAPRWA